jgi:hypothetical protein
MSLITRALAALATITLLSVDDVEAGKAEMNRPNNISALDWARYNESQARTLAQLSGLPPAEPGVLELAPYEVRTDTPIGDLTKAVERAASELHGQGPKSDRIALQLLAALGRFHTETGTP